MLQNIRIAVGQIPPQTGNLREDNENIRLFLVNLLRALEMNFDQIEKALTENEKGGAV